MEYEQVCLEAAQKILPDRCAGTQRDLAKALSDSVTDYLDWREAQQPAPTTPQSDVAS